MKKEKFDFECKQCKKKYNYKKRYELISYDFTNFCSQKCWLNWKRAHLVEKTCLKCKKNIVKTLHPDKEHFCPNCKEDIKLHNTTTYHFNLK